MTRPVDEVGVYALLTDGATVEIRPAQAEDYAAVHDMHAAMSPGNTYFRFFDPSPRAAAREAQRICREADGDHAALLAWLGDQLIGVASYERTRKPGIAEIAFAVADHIHSHGVATLLLEHLVSVARKNELVAFTAEVLAANADMAGVLTDAGLPVQRRAEEGMIEFTLRLAADEAGCLDSYLNAVDLREAHANAESLRHLLIPHSVAVIGAGQQGGANDQAILRKIITGGFRGSVYTVAPGMPAIAGVTRVPSVGDLPESLDLAVMSVPPGSVLSAAGQCGRRGVKVLIVTTRGLGRAQRAGLLAACRRYDMRLVGPHSFGAAVPVIGLDASFAASGLTPGKVGLVSQSGGLGCAFVSQLSRVGVGVSSFASVGSESDVSANDMLMWWEQDGLTKLAVLLIESFASPRKFARTARRISQSMPVLTMHPGRSPRDTETAASPAMAAALRGRHQALFEQAGIIATASFDELLETAAFLATQPVPTGGRVSVISNTGDAALRAAAACTKAGLLVHTPAKDTQRQTGEILRPGSAVTGPVHTATSVTPDEFPRCLELAVAGHRADAALVIVAPSAAAGDLIESICTADIRIPLAAVVLGQPESVRLLPALAAETSAEAGSEMRRVPAYASSESAARALANAVRRGTWSAKPQGSIPEFDDLRPASARALARRFLAQAPAGGWLPPADVCELLGYYGLPLAVSCPAYRNERARAAAPVITDDTTAIISVVQEPAFGPLIVFRRNGISGPDIPVVRMAPRTDTDADDLIQAIRPARPPSGQRAPQAPSALALREMLLRLSRLADDLPQVTELHLNPVAARPDGVLTQEASARVAPGPPQDPFLRRLR
jgi:acyl-CoA synthetase (NDP forming)/GNAT superfamily N-acetyltransferase